MYYAPANGIVSVVSVDEGDEVNPDQALLHITSHELEADAENLKIELKKVQGQLDEKTSLLNRGEKLTPLEKDQLEYELRELQTTAASIELQISQAKQRLDELAVVARAHGKVSTWNLRNRLLNHPVQAGQLLAATFAPEGPWRLQIAVPDYRAGMVAEAINQSSNNAVRVRFSLTSHPDQVLEAFATEMAPQVTYEAGQTGVASSRVVRTSAALVDSNRLPLKKDGAIARATVDCGKVPLCWLVFRDAYWALSSRFKMLW
jgi:multidrug efflux pump subunit AcrA (membrane-fusion protein)